MRKSTRAASLLAATAILSTTMAGSATLAQSKQTSVGAFNALPVGVERGFEFDGRAKMVVEGDTTTVDLNVHGLLPDTTYPAHLHNGTCANLGGAHYKHDPADAPTPPNELWPIAVADGKGRAKVVASAAWAARADARWVVIHDATDGAKIACADLQ